MRGSEKIPEFDQILAILQYDTMEEGDFALSVRFSESLFPRHQKLPIKNASYLRGLSKKIGDKSGIVSRPCKKNPLREEGDLSKKINCQTYWAGVAFLIFCNNVTI